MRKVYLLAFMVMCISYSKAQSVLKFSIKQMPQLVVKPLKNQFAKKGEKIQIGGPNLVSGGSGTYIFSWTPKSGLNETNVPNPIATADTTITYFLTITDIKGCSITTNFQLIVEPNATPPVDSTSTTPPVDSTSTTPNQPNLNITGISLYPNPNDGIIHIKSDSELRESSLVFEIFDPLGVLVYAERLAVMGKLNKTIRLVRKSKGLYFLRLNGAHINKTFKIVIQ